MRVRIPNENNIFVSDVVAVMHTQTSKMGENSKAKEQREGEMESETKTKPRILSQSDKKEKL